MATLDRLSAEQARAAAAFLDERTLALRFLVAFLRHLDAVPEEALAYWRLLWKAEAPRALLAHFFHNGTTYACAEAGYDWGPATALCEADLLPERIIGDREVIERWRAASPAFFGRATKTHLLEILAAEPGGADEDAAPLPEGFRPARRDERAILEGFERLQSLETGLDIQSDFDSLIEAGLVFVIEEGGEVIGCMRSNLSDGRYVHAGGLYVPPAHRGRRLGEKLARGLAQWVRREPGVAALVDVHASNEAALRAYRGAGFRKVGEGLEVRFPE
jgi:ribosomal protein S18 acetylase RimI-like enzyme